MSPVVCKLLVTPAISLDRYWIHHDAVVTHTIGSKNCSTRGPVKTGALKNCKDFGLKQQDRKVPDTEIEPVQQWRSRTRSVLVEAMAASAPQDSNQEDTDRKSEEYNKAMQRKMKNPYEYHHELGNILPLILDEKKRKSFCLTLSRDYAADLELHPQVSQHNPLTGVAYPVH
jgi:hypothetical protein